MIVGVTGGMGSGKSIVSRLLGKLLEKEVLDADLLCRHLLEPNMPGWQGVKDKWGARFINFAGHIDRVALRKALFTDSEVRYNLEQLLHPLVRKEILRLVMKVKKQRLGMVVEVPLLFEVGWQDDFDLVVAVYSGQKSCLERIVKRDQVTLEEGKAAISVQMSLEEKALLADCVIDNSGPLAWTVFQVHHLARLFSM
ncbi:MAG: dephospho-CoA [Desulfobulbaceae bacterium]|nr:MAG: dephospho-CoA [Desulfobulbaceae bacterium]